MKIQPVASVRQRIIEKNRYRGPNKDEHRPTRINSRGHIETYKLKGDKIITFGGLVQEIRTDGWS